MIFLYVQDGHGVRVVGVRQLPAVIGRSATCDVVLEHETISPRHARLELGPNGPRLVDLASENGLHRDGARVAELDVGTGASVLLGGMRLDLTPTERLAPTRILDRPTAETSPTRRVFVAVAALLGCYLAFVAAFALEKYARYWPPERSFELFTQALGMTLFILGGSALLALFSKVHNRRYQFIRIAGVISGLVATLMIWQEVSDTLIYNARLPWLRHVVDHASFLAVVVVGLFGLTATLFPAWTKHRQAWAAAIVALSLDGVASLYDYYEYREGDRQVHGESVALPVLPPTLAAVPTAHLLSRLEASKQVIDGYRTERQAELKRDDAPAAASGNH
jgi:hypothetical protein